MIRATLCYAATHNWIMMFDIGCNKMKTGINLLLVCFLSFHVGCAKKSTPAEAKDIVKFKANSVSPHAHFKGFKIEREDLEDVIKTYHEVTEEHWRHNYHHIAMNDVTGIIILKDGTEIKWMVRPGGLATLTYPDGRIIYLAKELTVRSEE